jgi:hypothetical protein
MMKSFTYARSLRRCSWLIRASRMLRDEGILDFTRGRGDRVVGTPQRSAVMSKLDEMLAFARRYGYQPGDVVEMIQARR